MAGSRPSCFGSCDPAKDYTSLLGYLKRVVYFDTEVADGAFKFRMAEQELNGPEIPSAAIDQSRLGSPH
jgi:hypothetical protein